MKYIWGLLALVAMDLQGQSFGEIKGRVLDAITGEEVPLAHVWVETGAEPIGMSADIDGKFHLKPLEPGVYDLHVKDVRYNEFIYQGVEVRANEISSIGTIELSLNTLVGVEIVEHIDPLIRPDNPEKITISGPDLKQRADAKNTRSMIVSMVPGITASPDGQQLYFRGSRPENMVTFIDGVKIKGGELPRVPSNAIQNLAIYTGGIPAKYGDMTGGVVVIETKGYMDFYRESLREQNRRP